jgi:hypothetical protein
MNIHKQIMALPNYDDSGLPISELELLEKASNLAEARENELLAEISDLSHDHGEITRDFLLVVSERAQMIAELLSALKLNRLELDGLPHSLGYEFTHIKQIDAIINKYEELK